MAQFRMHGTKLLCVDLQGDMVKALTGSMVAYEGQMNFKKQSLGGQGGLKGAFKRKLTGESLSLMEVQGQGTCYIANNATEIVLIPLQGHTLWVEASNLLALDAQLHTDSQFTGLRGATTGQGLFTTTVTGHGTAAIMSDGPAICLEVSPQYPVVVDPQAYIAHVGQLNQNFITDVSWRNMVGESSGEAFQIAFQGQGLVYIQPAERVGGIEF